MRLQADSLVDDVMRTWPATIPTFLRRRMKCAGCPMGIFHTVCDACREHDEDLTIFLSELCAAAGQEIPSGMIVGVQVSDDSAKR